MTRKTSKILVVDDNQAVHEDYRKVLETQRDDELLNEMESMLFGGNSPAQSKIPELNFQIDSAFQGEEGLELVKKSVVDNSPYAVAFIDMRMPPGWNGTTTAKEIWKIDANLPVVICTAYTDHTWEEIISELTQIELLLILKKPFDNIELKQMAASQSGLRNLIELSKAQQPNAFKSLSGSK